jgi:hypothetical protein
MRLLNVTSRSMQKNPTVRADGSGGRAALFVLIALALSAIALAFALAFEPAWLDFWYL